NDCDSHLHQSALLALVNAVTGEARRPDSPSLKCVTFAGSNVSNGRMRSVATASIEMHKAKPPCSYSHAPNRFPNVPEIPNDEIHSIPAVPSISFGHVLISKSKRTTFANPFTTPSIDDTANACIRE